MEQKTAESMVAWLQEEYSGQFDFNKIKAVIELMLVNHRRKILE